MKKHQMWFVGVAALVVLWVEMCLHPVLRVGIVACLGCWRNFCLWWVPGAGEARLKRFLLGLKPDTTGGIFLRACVQDGDTAFDNAKQKGHDDIAVRDRGRVGARRHQATGWR